MIEEQQTALGSCEVDKQSVNHQGIDLSEQAMSKLVELAQRLSRKTGGISQVASESMAGRPRTALGEPTAGVRIVRKKEGAGGDRRRNRG